LEDLPSNIRQHKENVINHRRTVAKTARVIFNRLTDHSSSLSADQVQHLGIPLADSTTAQKDGAGTERR
jgi:hypothetical protein